jgi:ketosteroid isomerase-like protein
MKARLSVTIAGLMICSAMSARALSGDLAGDVKALDELGRLGMKYDDAYGKKDAAALAALFTEDAVCATPEGLFSGRQTIEKACSADFQRWPATSQFHQTDQLNAVGNGAWSVGQWWRTLDGQDGPVFVRGYWSALMVPEGDGWKLRMLIFNETSPRIEAAHTR